MKTYAVGGSVRDGIMGARSNDYDWVVVGSTEEEMLDKGFVKVGADFPVFLHPENEQEYALARREKKTGKGYLGFESEFGTDVTLEQDLKRRDLTINSIAIGPIEDPDNIQTIDPYGGEQDILDKTLRHTSEAFCEDPVRVLRVARLRARFGPEWEVAPETQALIHGMAKSGTLSELQPERIWKELSRALMEPHPRLFFDTLLECDALHAIFPEIYRLKTALEARRWHPEGDAYEHTMLVLEQAQQFDSNLDVRYACLVHDIGKGITPLAELPKHHGHDVRGVALVKQFSDRLCVPTKLRDRAAKATRYHMLLHKLNTLNAKTFVKMFDEMSALNDPYAVTLLYCVGVCDERGRLGSENNTWTHLSELTESFHAYQSVRFIDVFPEGEHNANKIKQGLYKARIAAVEEARRARQSSNT